MATCIQCKDSKKKKVFIAEQYCDVCGFGFLPEPENKGRTCRDPKRIFKSAIPLTKEKEVKEEATVPEPVIDKIQVVDVVSSSAEERVFQVIKAHPLIGKGEILSLAQVSDGEYTEAKDALLASKRITQEGTRRGAKYKVV